MAIVFHFFRCELSRYLGFISERASGALLTEAQWMRKFIRSHPDYKNDSVVSERINYDLVQRIAKLANGACSVMALLGIQCYCIAGVTCRGIALLGLHCSDGGKTGLVGARCTKM